ncbi:putative disease resistance RPP8-like protein 2 [Sesamum angolense]|uniref:Disease resistance RPP8-like protein 2 n=1 Tax=Sesamum angolense TaxID=2727404 RepID=A0AAE1X6J9_9LAMI|nr:putative disease resistance RPP8-like protein 2 [Sesamum angolense]
MGDGDVAQNSLGDFAVACAKGGGVVAPANVAPSPWGATSPCIWVTIVAQIQGDVALNRREIVKQCGCLPLPISVLGGILRQEKTSIEWEKVCRNLDSYLRHGKGLENDKRVEQILDLSYNVLPFNLKPCFLYFACFREDEDIEIKDLYSLWMAEGMISLEDRGRGESLQDVAERYLFELASRCMVQVKINEYSIHNRFKSCRLHDLILDLCLLKGKTEGFVDVVDRQIGRDEASSVCKIGRLAIHLDNLDDDHIRNIGKNKNLRSLLFLEKRWKFIERNHIEDVNFGVFKSLKILIFESYKFKDGKLPKGIEHLILLKLLSIKDSNVEELPASVCKLPCLQSLNLQVNTEMKIPNLMYKLRRLRHLYMPNAIWSRSIIIGGGKLKLDGLNDLETLIGFSSSIFEITHLLKLQKLRVLNGIISDGESLSMIVDHILNHQDQFHDTQLFVRNYCNVNREEDGSTLFRRLVMCHSLSNLRTDCGVIKLPTYECHMLYRNVTVLTLEKSKMEEDPMGILEKLPMLRQLRLESDAYVGREMVCRATGFPQLRSLFLSELSNLVKWRVEKGAMPNLSTLELYRINKLEMLPNGLKFITALKSLIINDMPENFKFRARVGGQDYHKIEHVPSIQFF